VLVAATGDDDDTGINKGAVYLFDGESAELLTTFSNQTPEGFDTFGFGDTPITSIGDIVLIGNTRAGLPGEAYGFDGNPASPTLGELLVPIPNPVGGDFFGGDIVTSGSVIAIGADGGQHQAENRSGIVALYQFDPQGKVLAGAPTIIENPTDDTRVGFGLHMAISDTLLVVAANGQTVNGNLGAGVAHVYDANSSSLKLGQHLITLENPNPTPMTSEGFGAAVEIVGSLIAVSTFNHDPGDGDNNGTVYIFDGDPQSATFGNLLHDIRNPGEQFNFGLDMVAIGNLLAVGGSESVDIVDPATGNLVHPIDPPPDGGGSFGRSVAATENGNLVVGAPFASNVAIGDGVVYLLQGP